MLIFIRNCLDALGLLMGRYIQEHDAQPSIFEEIIDDVDIGQEATTSSLVTGPPTFESASDEMSTSTEFAVDPPIFIR